MTLRDKRFVTRVELGHGGVGRLYVRRVELVHGRVGERFVCQVYGEMKRVGREEERGSVWWRNGERGRLWWKGGLSLSPWDADVDMAKEASLKHLVN